VNGNPPLPNLPLPPGLRELIGLRDPNGDLTHRAGNRSLLFDKGMDRYDRSWRIGGGEKTSFLQDFLATFRSGNQDDFEAFRTRREAALASLGARSVPFVTQTRLVVGLGLPSPLETGFLFDRLTGCPYLPGSSVKGLLRATALLVRKEEIPGEKAFWDANFERIFGPEISSDVISKTGEAVFYDAFPARWPEMELDVLTPHYGKHYRKEDVPADWDNPVPVPFLAIAAGVPLDFYITAKAADFEELTKLLGTGLDWLGIGAKKSTGYGVLGPGSPAAPAEPPASIPEPKRGGKAPQAPPASPPKPEVAWSGADLTLRQGFLEAWKGKQLARGRKDDLDQETFEALKKHKTLRADLVVLKISNSEYRIVEIKSWKKP
jgi:CRISPR-associated protein Cmr6